MTCYLDLRVIHFFIANFSGSSRESARHVGGFWPIKLTFDSVTAWSHEVTADRGRCKLVPADRVVVCMLGGPT